MKIPPRKNIWIVAAGTGAFLGYQALMKAKKAYSFAGKVVLITGGSRGLGLVLARQFSQEGAKLAICARDQSDLALAQQELQQNGAAVLALPCDVRHENEVNTMIRQVEDHYGRIDVLINNAGIIQVGPLENMTLQEYREAMDTHYWAPLYTMLAVLPGMKQRREGRIVNIASVGGKVSLPHLVPYSGSKFALVGLSQGFRAELKEYNIPVTTINPGLTRTGSPRNAIIKGQHEKEYAWFSTADVLPLVTMSAEETARKIIKACRHGDAEHTLTLTGKLAAGVQSLFPGFVSDYFGLIDQLLPDPGSYTRASGAASESDKTPNWVKAVNDKVGKENNQI